VTVADVHTQIGTLSGGQRQIIAIARAVRAGARAVLLDEPTAALGVREMRHAADIITALQGAGNAVAVVSHNIEFVFAFADRIQAMRLDPAAGDIGSIAGSAQCPPVRHYQQRLGSNQRELTLAKHLRRRDPLIRRRNRPGQARETIPVTPVNILANALMPEWPGTDGIQNLVGSSNELLALHPAEVLANPSPTQQND